MCVERETASQSRNAAVEGCADSSYLDGLTASAPSSGDRSVRDEAIHIEGRGAAEHEVGRTTESGGENAERLALAVLGAQTLDEALASGVLLEEEDRGL